MKPKYVEKCPKPVPSLDYRRGADLPYNPPGYTKTILLLVWKYRIITAVAILLALAL